MNSKALREDPRGPPNRVEGEAVAFRWATKTWRLAGCDSRGIANSRPRSLPSYFFFLNWPFALLHLAPS
jgi:hypothetical protein